ncbi:MAG: hypothetical protein OXM55_03260 [Bdellovibrionales bacterium]|nr:hypothetical protein [Bdellovibrionales bacterium]
MTFETEQSLFLQRYTICSNFFYGAVVCYGVLVFDLSLLWEQVVLTFTVGFLTQCFWKKKLYRTGIEFASSALRSLWESSLQKPKNSNKVSLFRTGREIALFRDSLPLGEKKKQPKTLSLRKQGSNQIGINLSRGHFLSVFITCLSLVLLLRSNNLWIHPLASFIAISSKFCVQYNKQHFFNPSAFGIFVVFFFYDI